jgi:hypothetical protein
VTKIDDPLAASAAEPTDYRDPANWLSLPTRQAPGDDDNAQPAAPPVDLFFCYPTAWRARQGQAPLCTLDNSEMRRWADFYLKTRASAFSAPQNIYAPYYRQLDAAWALSQKTLEEGAGLMLDIPYTDVESAFDHYIKHHNNGRPFMLAGHSQGSVVLLGLLCDYLAKNPRIYERMVAAYLIGIPISQDTYAQNPHLRPAERADDLGVIISYNTQTLKVDGPNPLASPTSLLINPISWRTDTEPALASQSLGSVYVHSLSGRMEDLGSIASACIDHTCGVVICDVDREKFSSKAASRAYFPLGVLHENDIPLYYYDLLANAKLRTKTWLAARP